MTEPTRVRFETLPPVKLYIPGPNAQRAGNALRDMQQTITATLQAMRHSTEADHDPIALEVMADRLQAITRKVRRAERAHVQAWTAEVQARKFADDMNADTDTETTDDDLSTTPERHPQ